MIEAEYRLCPGRDLAGINLFLSSSGGGAVHHRLATERLWWTPQLSKSARSAMYWRGWNASPRSQMNTLPRKAKVNQMLRPGVKTTASSKLPSDFLSLVTPRWCW